MSFPLLRPLHCFLAILLLGQLTQAKGSDPQQPKSIKVLFIGNSYTQQVRPTLEMMVQSSPYRQSSFSYITPGGKTLTAHLQNKDTLEKIKTGGWNYVVLQEQSLTPMLAEKSFQKAATQLCKLIKDSGAKPVFYMTWERRDKEAHKNMQKKLSAAYRKAATNNQTILVPAGDVWAKLRQSHPQFSQKLYKADGSHPSTFGAYLVSCSFLHTLFGSDLNDIDHTGKIKSADAKIIRNHVLKELQ